ncbi:Uncharacterised protein [Vibrio cholerae]|nr:Uncharacterised protein [Vibrio cholerae]
MVAVSALVAAARMPELLVKSESSVPFNPAIAD